jgi:ATP-dependent exoDNAse (exonuclease V) beta subunit
MSAPGHVMILASAGSGKTYALTNRFVRLLAAGAPPERIVALTFTRKAAGEFFDEILHKLGAAAAEPTAARTLAAQIGAPGLGPLDFRRMLRTMVEAMPRLALGTLDGFFARIVRSFPLELGLGGEFTLLEESAARLERRRVLRGMFAAGNEPDRAQREFVEAFKRATFGAEEKQLARRLEGFLDEHAENYLDAPQRELWGNPRRIWPGGVEWLEAGLERGAAARAFGAVVPWAVLNDKQRLRIENFLADLPAWEPGAPLPRSVEYLLRNALVVWPEMRAGRAEITLERKKVLLNPDACAALVRLGRAIVGAELGRKLEMTRGLFDVLQRYDEAYHERVRRGGRLTFADVQRLLLPAQGAPMLSGTEAEDGRLLVDWRLDAQFDHWLLDEFQDTSYAQWSVLRSLLDEVVQDPEKRRTLFYVGDAKQAIFGWREGDPRLFREVLEHYNRADPGAIAEEQLTDSWRSGPAVIALVNRVFGDQGAIRGIVPADAALRWSREWRDHTSAKPALGGYAELRHADDEAGRFAETLRILREVCPERHGLSVAVIVQRNDTAARLADFLRREGNLPAVAESDLHFASDNPLTCGLLAVLKVAAHPGDTFARELLAMGPIGALLAGEGINAPDQLTTRILGQLQVNGFAATIEQWMRLLEPRLAATDDFSRMRARQLVEAARSYDVEGRRDVADFLAWAEGCTVRAAETAGVIRVLTVHKSKGLGFDLVILPDLEGQTLAQRRDGLAIRRAEDRAVEWVLDLPGRIFCEHDAILTAQVAGMEADAAYEALCKFYVAMTRAKRAAYLITEPVGKSTSQNFPKLLQQTLGEDWREGDMSWYARLSTIPGGRPDAALLAPLPTAQPRRTGRLPSGRPSAPVPGGHCFGPLFGREGNRAADFGRAIHAMFESVDWWDASRLAAWTAARQAEGANPAALEVALRCLQSPALAKVFFRPSSAATVWREKAFEIVLDGVWLTGVFDRVVLENDSAGRAQRAFVYDFKTDRVQSDADIARAQATHGRQFDLYRRVAAILTSLPPSSVAGGLVLTAPVAVVEIPSLG